MLPRSAEIQARKGQPSMPTNEKSPDKNESTQDKMSSQFIEHPTINLPKGGGAIRGIGEKFQANPVTGSGSFSVPLPVSPGRGGFQPDLPLSYDSGGGNGPFGLGWHAAAPAITRKTDKELPRYLDSSESDTFLLAGAEDLVPVLNDYGNRTSREVSESENGVPVLYEAFPYRPRIEGLFARIEKWVDTESRLAHWRVITKENITSVYGKSESARVCDPEDPSHVFQWLIETSHDAKGNKIVYGYKQENSENIPALLNEKQRIKNETGFANTYLKRVYYSPFTGDADRFHFQLVFDYGEHRADSPEETISWPSRLDPFSTYKAGFEIRTYRLCRRVLMFHNFPENGGDAWQLVKSLDLAYKETEALTYLTSVTAKGYQKTEGGYEVKAMPPLEFAYTEPQPEAVIRQVDSQSLENLPAGLDETTFQWIDLAGEGSPGILSRHAGVIYYKENLGDAKFGAMKPVYTPVALGDKALQIMDVDGDGVNELVVRDGGVNGYYRYSSEGWEPFTEFEENPVIDWSDPNLKMIDLSGDGFPDIAITEEKVLRWHPSKGAEGFEASRTAPVPSDELKGPKVLFSDPEQTIYLADMSGDGLTDIVRIRNGEVCYWPNLGYGRFGAKVFMAGSPRFTEAKEKFNPRYIKLGDVDGSGATDIVYLGNGAPRYYRNQAGNSWSEAVEINAFMPVDSLSSVSMVDLEGKGTMCLVWSTQIPGQREKQMSYIDLMGVKPHLLCEVKNNLGSVVSLSYAPSTKFYLEDKKNGKPWITRLSFPVHCLEKVETKDEISGSRFVTQYKYHHGYFDGVEREFRGFGMVEQWDTEEFHSLSPVAGEGGGEGEATNLDPAFYVPPVLTKTWFHTGIFSGGGRVSDFFAGLLDEDDEGEYYREPGMSDTAARSSLLPDTIMPEGLTPEEKREACRALKGQMLRQEVYAQDNTDKAGIPYTVTEQNFTIEPIQSRADNRHAVFFTHAREAITCHYERNADDPRITHALTLDVDKYGNVLKSLAVGYGRKLSPLTDYRDQIKQTATLITYTGNVFTNAIDNDDLYPDDYRAPMPAETRTYELTGFQPENYADRFSFDELTRDNFALLSSAAEIPYEQTANNSSKQKRLIEHIRTFYRSDDLTALLPMGDLQPMALPGESYKLALTPGLVAHVFKRQLSDGTYEELLPDPAALLGGKGADQGGYSAMDGNWWISSGRSFYDPDADIDNPVNTAAQELNTARAHFYLPRKFADAFGLNTRVDYDDYDLLIVTTRDALDNTISAENDYRVLQPRLVIDPNRNRTEVAFDTLGMVVATAVMGKEGQYVGDLLEDVETDPSLTDLQAFIADPQAQAASLLGKATTRIVYDLDRWQRAGQPPFAATLSRETHFHDPGGYETAIQVSFSYSDGFGREIQKKIQAEPGDAPQRQESVLLPSGDIETGELVRDSQGDIVQAATDHRWVGTGRTVFNNKGKPVMQYEPFFSATHLYESESEMTDTGVSPVLFYDPVERVIATIKPDHTYEKVVFDPWQQATYDVNDTVAAYGAQTGDPRTDPDISGFVAEYFKAQPDTWQTWYDERINYQMGEAGRDAAEKAAAHADTPTIAHFDTLGRTVLTITNNRYERDGEVIEEENSTRIELDIEGNQRSVTDAKDRVVMKYDYHIAGPEKDQKEATNRIHQASMEAGERWILNDVTGKAIRAWDSRGFLRRTTYDELRRPTGLYVTENGRERLAERTVYGESIGDVANHRTRVYQVYDGAGIVTSEAYDFKGNLLENLRELLPDYKQAVDWLQNPAATDGSYTSRTTYDALNRPVTSTSPDGSIYRPAFNEANLLEMVHVNLRGEAAATAFVTNIDYDVKGQRTRIDYGNGANTLYEYDPLTYRLTHLKTTRPSNADTTASQLFQDATVVQDLSYTYDPVGNITRIEDAALRTVYYNGQAIDPIGDYTYDAIYRLTEARGREHIGQSAFAFTPTNNNYRDYPFVGITANPNDLQALRNYIERYEYDPVGNFETVRHAADGGGWTRTYDYEEESLLESDKQSNRLSGTTVGSSFNRTEAYTHDAHGNMTSMPHITTMAWDFEDQLQQVDLNGGGKAYYVYDVAGQRTRKVIESQSGIRQNERIYLGGFEIYREYSGNGAVSLERETLHVMDDKQRIALVDTRTQGNDGSPVQLIRYQLGNHLGSASAELDNSGSLISYEEYYPYGTTAFQAGRSASEVSLKRYRYTGKERDDETGFSYHGARYYAPWLGRWVNADPAGLVEGPNIFSTSRDNPVNRKDSTGLQSVGELIEQNALQAAKEERNVSLYLWAFADVAWKVFGAEGVSKVASDPKKATVGDYISAGIEVASVIPVGKIAKAGKGLLATKGVVKEAAPAIVKEVAKEAAPTVIKEAAPTLEKEVVSETASAVEKEVVKETAPAVEKEVVKETAPAIEKEAVKETASGVEKQVVKEAAPAVAKEAAEKAIKTELGQFTKAGEYGIKEYSALKSLTKGTGLEAHHLIEQRLAKRLGVDPKKMASIALTPAEHNIFTQAWKKVIGYKGMKTAIRTDTATKEQIAAAAKIVYKDYPEILKYLENTILKF